MKLLFPTTRFAGQAMISFHSGRPGLFFAGEQPPVPAFLALELPGLTSQGWQAITAWLAAHTGAPAPRAGHAGDDVAIPRALWRRAALDDFLDAANALTYVWYIATYFTLAEIATFAEAHGPTLDRELRAALAVARDRRPAALAAVGKRAERIVPVLTAGQQRLPQELEALKLELDREDIARLVTPDQPVADWIARCADLRSDTAKRELVERIATRLATEDAGALAAALDRMLELHLDKLYAPALFTVLGARVPLPQNVHGARIDLTSAREVIVPASWDTYKARRIGPVKIGRRALFVAGKGARVTYVRGERKLKHHIARRGGSITRWGNTLTIGGKPEGSAHEALLGVDRIDALAQLAPAQAVALLADAQVTPPIREALARAGGDPRWRRVLADLLIERIVGIDADVARRLARAEAIGHRKRT